MKAAIVALLALSACATPPPVNKGVQITVTQERADQCTKAGGCGLLSAAEVDSLQRKAYQLGVQHATQAIEGVLDSNGCRRDKT